MKLRFLALRAFTTVFFGCLTAAAVNSFAQTPLADQPPITSTGVPANVMMALSVEWPTGVVQAYNDEAINGCPGRNNNDSFCYFSARTYIGYFDPFKCYTYNTTGDYFEIAGYTTGASAGSPKTGDKSCSGQWSGNYLNWATMQTVDMFRWAMVGGDRFTDNTTLTLLRKARHDGQGGFGQFPLKRVGGGAVGAITPVATNTVTPYSDARLWSRVSGLNTVMWVSRDRLTLNDASPPNAAGNAGGNNPNNDFTRPNYTQSGTCAAYTAAGGLATCTDTAAPNPGTRNVTVNTFPVENGQCPSGTAGATACVNTTAPTSGTRTIVTTTDEAGQCNPSPLPANFTSCSNQSAPTPGTRRYSIVENGQCAVGQPDCVNVTAPAAGARSYQVNVTGSANCGGGQPGQTSCVTLPAAVTYLQNGGCPAAVYYAGSTIVGCTALSGVQVQVTFDGASCPSPVSSLPAFGSSVAESCTVVSTGRIRVLYRRTGSCPVSGTLPGSNPTLGTCSADTSIRNVTATLSGSTTCAMFSGTSTCTNRSRATISNSPGVCDPSPLPANFVAGSCTVTTAPSLGTRRVTITENGQCAPSPTPAGFQNDCVNLTAPTLGTRRVVQTRTEVGQCSGFTAGPGESCANTTPPSIGTRTITLPVTTLEAGQCNPNPQPANFVSCANVAGPFAGTRQISNLAAVIDAYQVRVKVCDAAFPESTTTCTIYPNAGSPIQKPTGLIHENSLKMRFGAFGYLLDNSATRDGGVLRARLKDVGPLRAQPGAAPAANARREWDAATGIYVFNPEATDATATGFGADNSGVINYLTKFGRRSGYKGFDPVSEMYAEAVKYYRNLGPTDTYANNLDNTRVDGFPVITAWDDPIQYYCQKNFIIGIADANTHKDKNLNGNGTDAWHTAQEPATRPANVDTGYNVITETQRAVDHETTLSGSAPPNVNDAARSFAQGVNHCCDGSGYVAGIAYWANTNDMRSDLQGKQTIQTYFVDVREAGSWGTGGDPRNQLWMTAKYGGFIDANNNGQLDAGEIWSDPVRGVVQGQPVPKNYFAANQPERLVAGLRAAFADINSLNAAGAGVGVASPNIENGANNTQYRVTFSSQGWTGKVEAIKPRFDAMMRLVVDPVTGVITNDLLWDAQALLNSKVATGGGTGWQASTRYVITSKRSATAWVSGVALPTAAASFGDLGTNQLAALGADDTSREKLLKYLRGDCANEGGARVGCNAALVGEFRQRPHLLGDIVDSQPIVVSTPNAGYTDGFNPGYSAFKTAQASRIPMLYVGANDGMLHAFKADPLTANGGGQELFAYIPGVLFEGPSVPSTPTSDGLAALAEQSFQHRYFVNATGIARDVDFKRAGGAIAASASDVDWRTIYVSGLGKGGRAYFALDVTNPATITSESAAASRVLWEFTDPDLGFTHGKPLIIKTPRWGWVVMLASGYNNTFGSDAANRGRGFVFFVHPQTGALLKKVKLGGASMDATYGTEANPSGAAHLTAFVQDFTDFTADIVYIGDLNGNLWRIDVSSASADPADPTTPMAVLKASDGTRQPITSEPRVAYDTADFKRYVFIGTGRYLDTTDTYDSQVQSFYAIRDGTRFRPGTLPSGVTYPVERDKLVPVTNFEQGIEPTTAQPMGWYVDMTFTATGAESSVTATVGGISRTSRERIVAAPDVNEGVVTFTTLLPTSTDPCQPAGRSKVFALDYGSGRSVLFTSAINPLTGVREYTRQNYSQLTNTVVDVRQFKVEGQVRTFVTTGSGATALVGEAFTTVGAPAQVNWREVVLP